MKPNKKYNVLMFSTKIRGGKAFGAELKMKEFKKLFLKSKRLHKSTSSTCLEPKKLIQRAVDNMNKIVWQKYGFSPDFVEEKILNDEKFCEIYDSWKFAERYEPSDIKSDRQFHKKLRSPLEIGEKVLVLAKMLKKKKINK